MDRIRLKPGQTIGLKLTAAERELLVASVPFPDAAIEEKIRRGDASAQKVPLILPELRGLASCIQAQLRRTERDRKSGARLNRIWQRIVEAQKLFEQD